MLTAVVAEAESTRNLEQTRQYSLDVITDDVPFKPGTSIGEGSPTSWRTKFDALVSNVWVRRVGSAILLAAIAVSVLLAVRSPSDSANEIGQSAPGSPVDGEGSEPDRADRAPSRGFADSSPSESASKPSEVSGDTTPGDQGEFKFSDPTLTEQPDGEPTTGRADDSGADAADADADETDIDADESSNKDGEDDKDGNPAAEGDEPNPSGQPANLETGPSDAVEGQDGQDGDDVDAADAEPAPRVETDPEPVQAPAKPVVEAVSPGSASSSSPSAVPTRVTLNATGNPEPLEYEFLIYAYDADGNRWYLNRRSTGQSSQRSMDLSQYEGSDIRWTVVGRTPDGVESDESDPRYLRVASAGPQTISTNGGFEGTGVGPGEAVRVPLGGVNGWEGGGAGIGGPINIRGTGHGGIEASQGSTYVSLARAGSVAQLLPTVPGDTIQWTVTFRSGAEPGKANISIGPATGSTKNQGSITGGPNWTTRTGTYTVPPGQTVTRFQILGTQTEILIDNVQIVRQ